MVSKVAHVQDIAPIDLEQQQHRTLEEDMHGTHRMRAARAQ
jgi:hypothetical protein